MEYKTNIDEKVWREFDEEAKKYVEGAEKALAKLQQEGLKKPLGWYLVFG